MLAEVYSKIESGHLGNLENLAVSNLDWSLGPEVLSSEFSDSCWSPFLWNYFLAEGVLFYVTDPFWTLQPHPETYICFHSLENLANVDQYFQILSIH